MVTNKILSELTFRSIKKANRGTALVQAVMPSITTLKVVSKAALFAIYKLQNFFFKVKSGGAEP